MATRERPNFWFRVAIALIWPTVQLFTRRDRKGWENLPTEGGVILAVNHLSVVDPLTLAQAVYDGGRLPHYMAKSSLFDAFFFGRLLRGCQQIPVRRASSDAAQALSAAVEAVQDGACVLIYPEGTTSRDPAEWPMKARTGVARLALTSGAPVLPLAQWGAQQLYRRGGRPHPFGRPVVATRLGPPVDLSSYQGRDLTPALLREVTDLIMAAVVTELAAIRGEQPPVPGDGGDGGKTPAGTAGIQDDAIGDAGAGLARDSSVVADVEQAPEDEPDPTVRRSA